MAPLQQLIPIGRAANNYFPKIIKIPYWEVNEEVGGRSLSPVAQPKRTLIILFILYYQCHKDHRFRPPLYVFKSIITVIVFVIYNVSSR